MQTVIIQIIAFIMASYLLKPSEQDYKHTEHVKSQLDQEHENDTIS